MNIISLKRQLGLGFNKAAPGAASKPVLDIPPRTAFRILFSLGSSDLLLAEAVELRADPAQLTSPRSQVQIKPGTFKAGVVLRTRMFLVALLLIFVIGSD